MNSEHANVEALVRSLYKVVLDRDPEQHYLAQHVARIQQDGGEGVRRIVNHFLSTHEYRQKKAASPSPATILKNFQSLGESCEFGLLQRRYELEPISFFRWASTRIDPLIQVLDTDFAGVGDSKNTQVYVVHGQEYAVRDIRLGFDMHTFIKVGQVDEAKFHITQSKRLQFLARRFREDCAAADQIMVRFAYRETDTEDVRRLFTALRRFGPVTLLHVTKAERPEEAGHVEWLEPGLMVGHIDRFGKMPDGSWDISLASWLKLCSAALVLSSGGPHT